MTEQEKLVRSIINQFNLLGVSAKDVADATINLSKFGIFNFKKERLPRKVKKKLKKYN